MTPATAATAPARATCWTTTTTCSARSRPSGRSTAGPGRPAIRPSGRCGPRPPSPGAWADPPAWRRAITQRSLDYEIRVKGVLDSGWSAWFDGLSLTSDEGGQTTIAGPIADQAALHGLLAKIRDLGLELLEVRCTDPG